jgi:hypothetical protein
MGVQSRRKGLVIGARWREFGGDQAHITDAADRIAAALFAPMLGACEPALDDVGVVHDPDRDELDACLDQAFASASAAGATLVLCLVGHGYRMTSKGPYHFVPSDHPAIYDNGDRGYLLADNIPRLEASHPGSDGVILLVDACESGNLWRPDRRGWAVAMRRVALATSTSAKAAYGARFTRVISEAMESGIPRMGAYLLLPHFRPLLSELEDNTGGLGQAANVLHLDDSNDWGLWLSINRAEKADEIDRLVWEVTRHQGLNRITIRYQRPEVPDQVADAITAHRMVAVLGPSGCGKSATLQMIAIDELDLARTGPSRPAGTPWQAVAFFPAAADTTPASFAGAIYDQLARSSNRGFEKAAKAFEVTVAEDDRKRMPDTERLLTGPMGYLPDGASVLLVVDALDQLPAEAADAIIGCLSELATGEHSGRARIVVSARHRPGHAVPRLPDGFTPVTMPDPSGQQIRNYLQRRRIPEARLTEVESVAAGNWLIITLLCNGLSNQPERTGGLPATREDLYNELLGDACGNNQLTWAGEFAPVMAVLACAGAGVALPLSVLRESSGMLSGPGTVAAVRGTIVALHQVVERIEPGTEDERVMLIHPTLVEHLSSPVNSYAIPPLSRAHWAVAEALATLAPMTGGVLAGGADDDPAAREYASRSEATHRWEAGDYDGAVQVLIGRPSSSARENRDRWVLWADRIVERFGPAGRASLEARQQLAFWTSRCGLYAEALGIYGDLVPVVQSSLGREDLLTLRVLFDEALCRGVNGHPSQTRDLLLRLVPRVAGAVGAADPFTLEVRHAVGSWTGLAGDPRGAVALLRPVLEDCQAALEPDHPETLACRNTLARWTGESGEPARAVEEFRALLPAQQRRLGPTHRETLRTLYSIAYWSGESGLPQQALQLMTELIDDQRRALGDEHPDTLRTLHGIGLWSGATGEPAKAVRVLGELLPVRERVLGPDHPDTLRTLNNLGRWTGVLGDYPGAIAFLQDTLERRTRTLGAEHPDTMRTVNNIIDWTGAAGDYRRAYELANELLPRQRAVLGDRHQDTMRTRFNRAQWLAADGDVATALEQLRALYRDQVAALGEQHPDAVRTARMGEELSTSGA